MLYSYAYDRLNAWKKCKWFAAAIFIMLCIICHSMVKKRMTDGPYKKALKTVEGQTKMRTYYYWMTLKWNDRYFKKKNLQDFLVCFLRLAIIQNGRNLISTSKVFEGFSCFDMLSANNNINFFHWANGSPFENHFSIIFADDCVYNITVPNAIAPEK